MKQFLVFLIIAIGLFGEEKKQTICLNMIVKNESPVIQRCLASVKPLIDYWVICDTGSTDGTQKIIRESMQEIPGELHEHAWVDFGHNRNLALELAKKRGDYILFIDADEVFTYRDRFQMPKLDQDCYFMLVQNERGGVLLSEYKRILLIKSSLDWKWEGVLHETLVSSQAKTPSLMKELVNISRTEEGNRFQDPKKFLKDALVLEKALEKEPNNSRYVYYIGQSYLNAGELRKALEYFEKRASMDPHRSDSVEVYLSLYCMGMLQDQLEMPSEKVIQSLSSAYLYNPSRSESLYYLANHLLNREHYLLAELVLQRAMGISPPSDEIYLFEKWIYDWGLQYKYAECSFKMGHFKRASDTIKALLKSPHLPAAQRVILSENLAKIPSSFL